MEKVIKTALQSYLYTQCSDQFANVQQHIDNYKQKYQCSYAEFNQNIQTNEAFLPQIQQQNLLWEEDAMEWLYWVEEYQTWEQRRQIIFGENDEKEDLTDLKNLSGQELGFSFPVKSMKRKA